MAKKSKNTPDEEAQQRQSRKDILIARKHERQLRNVRIAIISIAVLIALVIGIALVNELIITPDRTVATVGDSAIKLRSGKSVSSLNARSESSFLKISWKPLAVTSA